MSHQFDVIVEKDSDGYFVASKIIQSRANKMKTQDLTKFLSQRNSIFSVFSRKLLFYFFGFLILEIYSFPLFSQKPQIVVQRGHNSWVSSVAFSPDGKVFISAGMDRALILWETETGKEIRSFDGHNESINSVTFSPDGNKVISGSDDKTAKIWDVSTGKVLNTLIGHSTFVHAVAISPDGKRIASGGGYYKTILAEIIIWDAETGLELKSFKLDTCDIYSIDFSKNGKQIIYSSSKKVIKLLDVESGNVIKSFSGHKDAVQSVKFSPDGKYIISGSWDNLVKVWDIASGREIISFTGHHNSIMTICVSPDGKKIASGGSENVVKLWDIARRKEITSFIADSVVQVNALAFSPDSKTLLSSYSNNTLKLWDTETGLLLRTFAGQTSFIKSGALSPDGKKIIYGNRNTTINVWNAETGAQINSLKGHTGEVGAISFVPTGGKFISGSNDNTVKIWDTVSNTYITSINGNIGYIVNSLACSPDGKLFVSAHGKDFKIWDAETNNEIRKISGHSLNIEACAFNPDGTKIITGTNEGIKIWDSKSGDQLKYFDKNIYGVWSLAITADGKKIISGTGNLEKGEIIIWETETGAKISTIKGHNGIIYSVGLSPDEKFIVSGSWDQTVKLWNAETGELVKTFMGHVSSVCSVFFSPDGKKIISGSWDGTVKIWDVQTGNEIVTLISFNNGEWIVITPDGYFDCSKNGGEFVPIVDGMKVWGIDQFAIKNNRPDIILQRLGYTNTDMINHYYYQFQKRLKKSGFKENQLSSELHAPTVIITGKKLENKYIHLRFKLNDSKFNLKNYNIFVNNVPLYGAYGKAITGSFAEISEKVELSFGDNKIEISCLNEKGTESYRALTSARYNTNTKRDLYFLAFGVSDYQISDLNLQYAAKDATDLEKIMLGMKGTGFENVYTKLVLNENVTPESITKAKEFVKNARVDDYFVLFIAGHGVHDNDVEATYYFLSSNADPKNLKKTAVDFETIEDLLQGIAPRNKLFLMDACESGELDDDVQNNFIVQADQKGIKSRGMKDISQPNAKKKSETSKRKYLYQKDRYIYNDLIRRSGAIVFSSSKGGELSYERNDIENGLFTEYIMKAFSAKEADLNNDGTISTDELRKYVSYEVGKASGELQHPTVDRDNIFQIFGFPSIK